MKRFAVYARYSTDLQSDKSAEDQIRACKAYLERAGGVVSGVYILASLPEIITVPKPDKKSILQYRIYAQTLSTAIYEEDIRAPAIEALQSLIDQVVVSQYSDGTEVRAELYGDIAGLVNFQKKEGQKDVDRLSGLNRQLSVVAGARCQRQYQGVFQTMA